MKKLLLTLLSLVIPFVASATVAQESPIATTRQDGIPVLRLGAVAGSACSALADSEVIEINNDRGVLANGEPVSREGFQALCKTGATVDVALFVSRAKNTGGRLVFTLVPPDVCRESLKKVQFQGARVNGKAATGEADLTLCDRKGGSTLELTQRK